MRHVRPAPSLVLEALETRRVLSASVGVGLAHLAAEVPTVMREVRIDNLVAPARAHHAPAAGGMVHVQDAWRDAAWAAYQTAVKDADKAFEDAAAEDLAALKQDNLDTETNAKGMFVGPGAGAKTAAFIAKEEAKNRATYDENYAADKKTRDDAIAAARLTLLLALLKC